MTLVGDRADHHARSEKTMKVAVPIVPMTAMVADAIEQSRTEEWIVSTVKVEVGMKPPWVSENLPAPRVYRVRAALFPDDHADSFAMAAIAIAAARLE